MLKIALWQKTCRYKLPARLWSQNWACRGIQPGSGLRQLAATDTPPERLPEDLAAENARLRRENQELRDTNELLKAASAFFASELGPKR
ncbi:hypothetical protein [Corynebacterium belfantii]|uniref:hypothetical protein n=1 Tax=Corynebacterium belfantii TaxID=2014537 RepID=UPI0035A86FB7